MSGDVQPRKRKDKKKKRDDSDAKAAEFFARKMSARDDDEPTKEKSSSGVQATKMGPDDIQLHVHSDHGTGGHWCAKILFFSLMAVLLGLIGLILLENRGISDLDTPLSESRFAEYLEGWVDEKRESHDDHDVLDSLQDELDEHGDEPFEEEEADHDDDDDDHDEEHDNDSHEEEEDDEEVDGNHDEDDAPENENDDNDDDDDDTPREEIDDQNDDDDDSRQEESDNLNEETEDKEEENDNGDGEDDDDSAGDFSENGDNEDTDDNEIQKDDNDDQDEGFEDQIGDDSIDGDDNSPFEEHVSKANIELSRVPNTNSAYVSAEDLKYQVDELYGHYNKLAESLNLTKVEANEAVKEDDSDDASNEQFIDNDQGEDLHLQKLNEKEAAEQQNEEDEQDASSSLTVKLGVGLALVVVAHLVLVKRSKSNEEEKIESPPVESVDLKRRFTLITSTEPIPSDVDDEQPNEEEDDEYEEDDLKDEDGDEDEGGDLKDGDEDEVNEEEIVEDNENDEEYDEENENENSENSAESEEEIEDIENVGEEVDTVDTFTEMKNMYRPKNGKQSVTNDEEVDAKEEPKDNIDLDESDAEEDIEGSENSEDVEDVEEEEEEDEEEVSDVDDEDLMKRLESKYGKLPDRRNSSDEEEIDEKWTKVKRSGAQQDDDDFDDELRRTNEMLYDNPTSALKSFDALIEIKPNSSNAWYGKGKALDQLSEEQKSNELLKEAIAAYVKAVEFGSSVDDETFKIIAERCIDRMRFIGQHLKAVPVHEALIQRFNDDPYYRNQLAVTYLLINRLADAKLVLHETLLRWRQDGYALVHYGFILKNLDKNNEAAVAFLQEGIDSEAEGTNDGRFYFNLGEALQRLGRGEEAMAVYRKGASKKLFLSEYQRSLYNVDRLKSRPFWTKKQTGYKQYLDILQQNWEKIRDEGLSVLNDKGHFTDEAENLRDVGDWKQFDLFARGRKIAGHCARTPFTCKIIETFPAARFCKRGQVKFSVMHPGTHVWPHCGPTNCRIRAHLGLKVPEKTFIRVATETRSWSEGELLIFDDSFEHEVWHNGTQLRLVLIVDVWHPDLTEEERLNLYPI